MQGESERGAAFEVLSRTPVSRIHRIMLVVSEAPNLGVNSNRIRFSVSGVHRMTKLSVETDLQPSRSNAISSSDARTCKDLD